MIELNLTGLEVFPADDQRGIRQVLEYLWRGFAQRDADTLAAAYADDTDWVNAFGSVKRGRAEIVEYLRGLFVDANFNAGKPVAAPTNAVRKLSDSVAVVSSHVQIKGQGLVGGGEISLRDNHSLHILQKQPNASWLIVSEMFSDSRSDWSYVNHS